VTSSAAAENMKDLWRPRKGKTDLSEQLDKGISCSKKGCLNPMIMIEYTTFLGETEDA